MYVYYTNQGGKVTYQCKEGSDYVSGDYVRGCKADGSLTGESLVCLTPEVIDETIMPHRALTIEKFGSKYRTNTMYVIDTPNTIVPVSGKIHRWDYYSANEGTNAFQVWRRTSNTSKKSPT